MKRLLSIGFLSIMFNGAAQQVPQFSQYMRNQYMVNPGAAGVYDFIDVTLGGRMQWLGFQGAPNTSYLYASTPLPIPSRTFYDPGIRISNGPVRNPVIKTGKLKHALGANLLADQYGAFRQLKFAVTYAIHIPLTKDMNLSLGTNLGVSSRAFLQEKALVINKLLPNPSYVDATYDAFVANQASQNTMDIGTGLYLYTKKLFIGFAADQLSKDFIRFGNNTETNFAPGIHFHGTAGYKFDLTKDLTLMPAVLVKYINPAPISIDGSLILEYKEWMWGGVSFRNQDAIVVMAGMNLYNNLKFGYSFDYNVSKLNNYSFGGHELILGIKF